MSTSKLSGSNANGESCSLNPKDYLLDQNKPARLLCQQANEIEDMTTKGEMPNFAETAGQIAKTATCKVNNVVQKIVLGTLLVSSEDAERAATDAYLKAVKNQLIISKVRYGHHTVDEMLAEDPHSTIEKFDDEIDRIAASDKKDAPGSKQDGKSVYTQLRELSTWVGAAIYSTVDQIGGRPLLEGVPFWVQALKEGAVTAVEKGYVDDALDQVNKVREIGQHFEQNMPKLYREVGKSVGTSMLLVLLPTILPSVVTTGTVAAAAVGVWTVSKTIVSATLEIAAKKDELFPTTSLRQLLKQITALLQSIKLSDSEISTILGRAVVGMTSAGWQTTNQPGAFQVMPDQLCLSFMYFLNYAALAYCLDEQGNQEDRRDCEDRWAAIARRCRVVERFNKAQGDLQTVTYFTVFDVQLAAYVISFQGTSCLDDVLIDLLGNPTPFQVTDPQTGSVQQGLAHAQMLQVARTLTDKIVQNFKKRSKNEIEKQLPIICTGHSLGAGIATLVSILLREQGYTAFSVGIATPAVLSPNLAEQCKSQCISLVNGTDIVPRLSERALCNLSTEQNLCQKISYEQSLICPGQIYWMRKTSVDRKELVQTDTEFMQSIILNMAAGADHTTGNYLKSLQTIQPASPYALPEIDLRDLFSNYPQRDTTEFVFEVLPESLQQKIELREQALLARNKNLEADNASLQQALDQALEKFAGVCNEDIVREAQKTYQRTVQECVTRHKASKDRWARQLTAKMLEQRRALEAEHEQSISRLKNQHKKDLVKYQRGNQTLRERAEQDRAQLEQAHQLALQEMQERCEAECNAYVAAQQK